MRDHKEIMKEIEWLKEQLTILQSEVNKKQEDLKKEKVFKPKENEWYWRIDEDGDVCDTPFSDNYSSSRWDVLTGNYFRTKEEAEFAKQKRLIKVELQRFADEHNEEIDWENKDTRKYYIEFNYCYKEIYIYFTYTSNGNTVYFSSKEVAEQAIEQIGKDRIKKYIFGV